VRPIILATRKSSRDEAEVWSDLGDGIVSPSPACRRTLEWVCDALEKQGHGVVEFAPPSIPEGLNAGLQLCFGDGDHGRRLSRH
jgi:hypothetical protein